MKKRNFLKVLGVILMVGGGVMWGAGVEETAPLTAGAGAAEGGAGGVHREATEWLDVWIPATNEKGLPRVLLIGDSITKEYGPLVEAGLKGKAYVARLATSKSVGDPALLQEVALVLSEMKFDVVHFNNGMHGHDYTEAEYATAYPDLIAAIRKGAPGATLICATTTPTRLAKHLDQVGEYTARVIARNKAATALAEKEGITVDDLFAVVNEHPEFFKPDGVHHLTAGVEALAKQVEEKVEKTLNGKSH